MVPEAADGGNVMAAVDGDHDGERLIIADVEREDAWMAMRRRDAPALSECR